MSSSSVSPRKLLCAESVAEVRRAVRSARSAGATVGCVPTMGALHQGHLSLIKAAQPECDFVVVTIFVNPTQFSPSEDYTKYPRPRETDLKLCEDMGVDLVFAPSAETMYPDRFGSFLEVEGLSSLLEGACRPGHFRGVTTVVLKLFNIVQPDYAYFGQKDFQQQRIIRKMCEDLNLPVDIRVCPIVRDADGLATSSRNAYLSQDERASALALSRCLRIAEKRLADGEQDMTAVRHAMRAHLDATQGVVTDYATVVHPETLEELSAPAPEMVAVVAARVGATRLIDNLILVTDQGP